MSAVWLFLQEYGITLVLLAIAGFTLRVGLMMVRDVRYQRRKQHAVTLLQCRHQALGRLRAGEPQAPGNGANA